MMDIPKYFDDHIALFRKIADEQCASIMQLADIIVASLQAGGKLMIMGNGGSAADAQHFAAELVGRFRKERKALPAIALTTDGVAITAVGNDYDFESVFARQVQALAVPGDVVFGISTSGRSKNIVNALAIGKEIGCTTLGLLGCDGGFIAHSVDQALIVPSYDVPHIQEAHIAIIHILCAMIESQIFCEGGIPQ